MLYLFLFISLISNSLSEERGIYPMLPGDVGMVFWMTLANACAQKFHVTVRMIECTEHIGDNEEDTSSMYLIGGFMGILERRSTLLATLIFPNMYLYNRMGTCNIVISYTDEVHNKFQLDTCIKFCTIPRDGIVPLEVKEFYKDNSVSHCETSDLDPLDKCEHVDCMMKYLGQRSYYNCKVKRCQKVPVCVSDCSKDDPDVSYLPTSNRCRNLASCISESDISLLEEGVVTNNTQRIFSSRGLLLRCIHGRLDNITGICECNEGYTSAETNIENYVPGLTVYHMCNIRINSWNEANLIKIRRTILAFSTLALIITMIVLLLTFCCYGLYMYLKSYDAVSPFNHSSTESFEETDSDIGCDY